MLSRSMAINQRFLTRVAMRGFAANTEYDVAVIGGGPGGKFQITF